MTCEILFVNGKEIVMVADSAVTVGSFKTFNGVDKIFELSSYPAVGIMIYGSPVFENVPMESLIKHFRDECDITKMDSLLM